MKFSTKYENHACELAGEDFSAEFCGCCTRSEFADDCDINMIMSRYVRTGVLDHLNNASALFADVSALGDYTTLASSLESAQEAFMQLPAAIRKAMGNDPANFESFVSDSSNNELLKMHGLIVPAVTPEIEIESPEIEKTE